MFEKKVNFSASYFSSGASALKSISEAALNSWKLEELEGRAEPSRLLHKMKVHKNNSVTLAFIS